MDNKTLVETVDISNSDVMGPALPPHLLNKIESSSQIASSIEKPFVSNIEDEDFIGPVQYGTRSDTAISNLLEKRAIEIKCASLNKKGETLNETVREEWMTVLPDIKLVSNLGLEPRSFRTKEIPDFKDRSCWTDTPVSKIDHLNIQEKKTDVMGKRKRMETESRYRRNRDDEQRVLANKFTKKQKRSDSLFNMHAKKNNIQKQDNVKAERRTFNRETDLQVNKFDQARKQHLLKKAQLLNTRFQSGDAKYL